MAMDSRLDLEIPNELPALETLMQTISAHLENNGAGPGSIYAAEIALEELITNILKYSYDDGGPHTIKVSTVIRDGRFQLVIIDDGHEFDPFVQATPDTTLSVEEREIGGLGIHFVKNMLESCHYERRDGLNIITVEKAL
jgi:serine/threonine-protein kinase RsbW